MLDTMLDIRDLRHRVIELTNELNKQKKINDEIKKRFNILADEIKRIKDRLAI